jgi:hypothetical protein
MMMEGPGSSSIESLLGMGLTDVRFGSRMPGRWSWKLCPW